MFKLMIIIVSAMGYTNTYSRGEYHDFQSCAVAAQAEVERLVYTHGDRVNWQCVKEH